MLEAYRTHKTLDALEIRIENEAREVMGEIQALLDEQPSNDRALLMLARCQAAAGETVAGKATLQALLERDPGHVHAKVELAKIHYSESEARAAIALLGQATQDAPEIAANWRLLAEYLGGEGQTEASAEAQRQHGMVKAFNGNLAMAEQAFAKGELRTSDQMCRSLLAHVPGEIRTLRVLAGIAGRLRYYESAIGILEPCLESRPADAALRLDYARALLNGKKYREALMQCDRVTDLSPETIEVYAIQAEALYNLGQYEAAAAIYRELTQVEETRAASLVHLGKVLTTIGETGQAVEQFRQALTQRPVPCQAWWELASLKTYRFTPEEVASMERLLESGGLPDMDQILVRFALGRALEDEGRYEDGFRHVEAANHAYAKYHAPGFESRNAALKGFFTADYFASGKEGGSDSKAPIFVVGMPRSGSTLVEQILSAHSDVDATTELTEIVSIARELKGPNQTGQSQYPESVGRLTSRQLQDYAQRYLDFAQPLRRGAEFFIDKTPGNFHHVGLIKTLFPGARIIDVRRNPMASGWSLYKHFFADSFLYSYDLETLGRYYNDYLDLMEHWHRVLPGQILTLHYEDLVKDLRGSVETLLRHCSLPFEQACVDFHENRRAVATPSSEQVRRPIYDSAIDHWKNYERYLEPLARVIGARDEAVEP